MFVRLGAIAAVTLCFLNMSVSAHAERRVALLIGNAAYANAPLTNPANDVRAMKAALTGAGFDVVETKTDVDRKGMSKALDEFETEVKGADIGLVFYSGHGLEVNGTNYLVPIDATLNSERDVKFEAISLDDVLQALDGATKLKLVLLDACRENPFSGKMKRLATKGALSKGFAPMEVATPNTLIAYAAAPGATALDGTGNTSPFTAALAKHLVTRGLDVDLALRRVRDDVMKATGQQQVPFKTGSLGGEPIILGPPSGGPIPEPSAAADYADAVARADYDRAKAIGTVAGWDAFLANNPKALLAGLARAEKEKLQQAHLEPPGTANNAVTQFTCNEFENKWLKSISNETDSRDKLQNFLNKMRNISQNITESCEFIHHIFGGPIAKAKTCLNATIYFELAGPSGGAYVISNEIGTETQNYRDSAPSKKGQWLIGVSGAPYFCIASQTPMIVWPAKLIKSMTFR